MFELNEKIYRIELAYDKNSRDMEESESQSFTPDTKKFWDDNITTLSDGSTAFQTFIRNNYFDAEAFFRSVAIPDAPYYLYFGDLQSNLYYISDNMKDDFGFLEDVYKRQLFSFLLLPILPFLPHSPESGAAPA